MISVKQESHTNIMNVTTATTTSSTTENVTQLKDDNSYMYDVFKWHGAEIMVLIIIFIAGTVGNSLVLYIYHVRWRRSNFTFFIKILAAFDLFNCLVAVPLFFVMTMDSKSETFEPLCKTTSFIAMSNTVSSASVLVIVAFDRNRKINNPLNHEIEQQTTQKLGAGAVILGLAMSVPGVFLFGRKQTLYTENSVDFNITWCFFADDKLDSTLMFSYVGVLGAIFMLILGAMTVFYFSIWKTLRVHLKRRGSLGCHRGSIAMTKNGNYYRSQKTSAKLFFIITVAFFLSYFPYYISVAVFLMDDYRHHLTALGKSFADVAKLAPMASCAINPLIYSISSARFRREIGHIFKRAGRSSDAKKNILFNSLNSQDQVGQLNPPKHSKSHSGSSFGLKSVANDQVVFGKINLAHPEKSSFA